MRKLLYTTNIIESVNSKLRKATDNKRVFPSDEALLKSLYMVAIELEKNCSKSLWQDGVVFMVSFLFSLKVGFKLWYYLHSFIDTP